MKQMVLYVHGQGGSPDEAAHYRALFPECDVIGVPYRSRTPWEAKEEFPALFDALCGGREVILIANSIGAFFSMSALSEKTVGKAFFLSPIVDMERLISDMMAWANVSEEELRAKGKIATTFGQTLSWEYLSYVRSHPIEWRVPTRILYGSGDTMTHQTSVEAFADRTGAELTVMEGGEHWFHTEEQMTFVDRWITENR